MNRDSTLPEVENYCKLLYSGHKDVSKDFLARGWKGIAQDCGFPLLSTALDASQETLTHVFAARAISECLEDFFNSVPELISFYQWLLELLIRRREPTFSRQSVNAVCRLISTCVKRGYSHSDEIRDMPRQLAEGASVSQPQDCVRTTVAYLVLTDMVAVMGELSFSSLAGDISIMRAFRDYSIPHIFVAAAAAVRGTSDVGGGETVLGAALALLHSVLTFNYPCTPRVEGEEEDAVDVVAEFPSWWCARVGSLPLFQRLWTIYISTNHGSQARLILESLDCMVKVPPGFFTTDQAKKKWLDTLMLQSQLVMQRGAHLEDEDVRFAFCRLLSHVKLTFGLDELLDCEFFSNWAASCSELTARSVQEANSLNRGCVLLLLKVWTSLLGAVTYTKKDVSQLMGHAKHLMECYVTYMTSSCSAHAAEVFRRLSVGQECSGIDYALDDSMESTRLEIVAITDIALIHTDSSAQSTILANYCTEAFCLWEECTRDEAQHTHPEQLLCALERVSWMLHILCCCYDSSAFFEQSDNNSQLCVMTHRCFLILHKVLNASWIRDIPAVSHTHLQDALLAAVMVIGKKLMIAPRATKCAATHVEHLARAFKESGLQRANETFHNFFYDAVLRHVWHILAAPNLASTTRYAALQYLDVLTATPSTVHLLRSTGAYEWIAQLNPETFPAFIREDMRARFRYAKCIAQVHFLNVADSQGSSLEDFVSPLQQRLLHFTQTAMPAAATARLDAATVKDASSLFTDLRAVISRSTRKQYAIILDVMEPSLAPLSEGIVAPLYVGSDVQYRYLKMLSELAHNRGQRIVFGEGSARGYKLFHLISDAVQRAAPLIRSTLLSLGQTAGEGLAATNTPDSQGELEEWGWKALRVLLDMARNILRGGCINPGVMRLYQVATLPAFLEAIGAVVRVLPYPTCAVRPKVLRSVLGYANECLRESLVWWPSSEAEAAAAALPTDVAHMLGFLEATAFPSGAALDDGVQAEAMEALDRFLCRCRVRMDSPADIRHGCQGMVKLLLQYDANMFHRLLTSSLSWSMARSKSQCSQSLHRLVCAIALLHPEAVSAVGEYMINSRAEGSRKPLRIAIAVVAEIATELSNSSSGSSELRLGNAVKRLLECV